jgi:outer membrane receptor protein involved in Fe transport
VIRKIEPDTVWSYEVGGKNRLLDGRVQLDTSLYYIDWQDVQTILTLPGCGVPTTLNLGDARSQGADLAVTARVTDDLVLGVAVGYNDSEYTTTTPGATADIRRAGEPLGVPPWTWHVSGQYGFVALAREAYARLDYSYSSHDDTPLDVASPVVNPDIPRTPVIKSLDLRFGVAIGSLDLSLFAQNVTNEAPQVARYEDALPANYFRGTTLRPRTIGLTAVYRY